MIVEDDLILAGKFLKPHALKGELNVVSDYDSEIFNEDYPVIVSMDGIYVPFYVESYRKKGLFGCLLKLRGVDSVEDARSFVNKNIYLLKRDVAEFLQIDEDELVADEDYIGYEVYDKNLGYIGKVVDIDDSTDNLLLIVESAATGEEVYIPFADEFIEDVTQDDENGEDGRIDMILPEGIIDLNG